MPLSFFKYERCRKQNETRGVMKTYKFASCQQETDKRPAQLP